VSPLRITWAAQERFAELSGDRNPFHSDPVASRATPFGATSVHGFHLVLLALERLVGGIDRVADSLRESGASVAVTFRRPVEIGPDLDATVTVEVADGGDGHWRLDLSEEVWPIATVDLRLGTGQSTPEPAGSQDGALGQFAERPVDPIERRADDIAELIGATGSFPVVDTSMIDEEFGALAMMIGRVRVASIAAMSGVIGMQMPGLYSLDSSFRLDIEPVVEDSTTAASLQVSLAGFDERFGLTTVSMSGPGVRGRVKAFVRPAPVELDPAVVASLVSPAEFVGTRWLVVGGTRGLGAAVAGLAAAGGGEVMVTGRPGGPAQSTGLNRGAQRAVDVTHATLDDLAPLAEFRPTYLAYCATPSMSLGVAGTWSESLVERYVAVYADAFERVVTGVFADRLEVGEPIGVIWPSTASIEQSARGLAEFTAAKAAGEERCEALRQRWPTLAIAAPRVPRLATDQTAAYVPTELADPASTMLPVMRSLVVTVRSEARG